LNEIKQFLKTNYKTLDLTKVHTLILTLKDNLQSCIKPNEDILNILQNKRNFRTLAAPQTFAKQVLGKESRFKKRKDIEVDLTIQLMLKNIGPEKLTPYIQPAKPKTKRQSAKKKRKSPSKKKPPSRTK